MLIVHPARLPSGTPADTQSSVHPFARCPSRLDVTDFRHDFRTEVSPRNPESKYSERVFLGQPAEKTRSSTASAVRWPPQRVR